MSEARLLSTAARGNTTRLDDPPLDAHAGAMVGLHRAMCRYRHATRLPDALEAVRQAPASQRSS